MTKINGWVIEGKYTQGPGSEWEELDEVEPTDTGGPGNTLKGGDYARWLCREYITATPTAQHRVRPKKLDR
jgi:hypothetical protein